MTDKVTNDSFTAEALKIANVLYSYVMEAEKKHKGSPKDWSRPSDTARLFFGRKGMFVSDHSLHLIAKALPEDLTKAGNILLYQKVACYEAREAAISSLFKAMFGREYKFEDYKVSLVGRDEFPYTFRSSLRAMHREETRFDIACGLARYLRTNRQRFAAFKV